MTAVLMGVLALVVLGTLALHLGSAALTAWRYLRPAPPTGGYPGRPFVSLIRPVCGLDRYDAETLESSFALDYPDYEILFCAARESDPAVALVRDLIARHPEARAQLLIGEERISSNPKLNNLAKGWAAARADWIVLADSNLLLPTDYLDQLFAVWRPGTGLVTSPPAGIRGQGMWGAVECAFLNSFQARWQLAADQVGLGFAQGKTLMWPRDVLDRAGGLAALGHDLAEDVASTKVVRAQGLRVRLARRAFAQPIGPRRLADVWGRQLRWARVRRDGFVGLFVLEILLGPVPPVLAMLALGWGAWVPVLLMLWYGAEIALARLAGWPCGPRDCAAMVLRDLALPVLWLATWARRGFDWRGTAMLPVAEAEAAHPLRPGTSVGAAE